MLICDKKVFCDPMKIFKSEQIREIDEFTIRNEPVASIDLMERAVGQLLRWHQRTFDRSRRVVVFLPDQGIMVVMGFPLQGNCQKTGSLQKFII